MARIDDAHPTTWRQLKIPSPCDRLLGMGIMEKTVCIDKAWNSLPQEERCKLCREWTEESAKKDSVNGIRNALLMLMCIPAFECFNHGSISKFFEEFGCLVSAMLVAWVIRDIDKSHCKRANEAAISKAVKDFSRRETIQPIGDIKLRHDGTEWCARCDLYEGYSVGRTRYQAVFNLLDYAASSQAIDKARGAFSEYAIVHELTKIFIEYDNELFTARCAIFEVKYDSSKSRYEAVCNLLKYATDRYPRKLKRTDDALRRIGDN